MQITRDLGRIRCKAKFTLCTTNVGRTYSHELAMWWVIGAGIWLLLLVVTVALCAAAGDSDRRMEEMEREASTQASRSDDRAA